MLQEKEIYSHLKSFEAPFVFAISEKGENIKVISSTEIDSCLEVTFPIYSLTKTFISVLILKSCESDLLSLDDELGDFIQDLPVDWLKGLKVRHLLTHRSGLADYEYCKQYQEMVKSDSSSNVSEAVLIEMVIEQGIKFPQGERFQYSNIGYLYLRKIIEVVHNYTFPEVVKKEICSRLKLKSTSVAISSRDLKELTFITLESESIGGGDMRQKYNPSWVAHGLITSNINDLAIFFREVFSGNFLNKDSKLILNSPIKLDFPSEIIDAFYGLGVMGDPESKIGSFLGHDGGGPGYSISAYHQKLSDTEKDFFLIFGKENIRGIDILTNLVSSFY